MAFRLGLAFAALVAALSPLCGQGDRPSLRVPRLLEGDTIQVDGWLDEQGWKRAGRLGPLTQVEPVEGAKPSKPTDVFLCFDDDFLYLGVVCHDEPGEVRARDA